MSHHFDTKHAKENPSLNICDAYLFAGKQGHTVMALTVNADAGLSAPDTLPDEGLYAFRFDLDGDAKEDVVFKFRFGTPSHVDGDEHVHTQSFQVIRASGDQIAGTAGELLVEGKTNEVSCAAGVQAFAGVAPELWAADAIAFFNLLTSLNKEDRFDPDVFLHRKNFFKNRNVVALVLEVPNGMIGMGNVHLWTTASLFGHAPEIQICRWGLPLFSHLFLSDSGNPALAEKYHANLPAKDVENFGTAVSDFTAKLSERAGSTANPKEYGKFVSGRLCPVMLPYEIGTEAKFGLAGFNGRPLGTDAYDVMLTIGANRPIMDGVRPDLSKIQKEFPYYGERYSKEEQTGLEGISTGFYE